MIGIDATGLTIPTQAQIADDIGADIKANVDPLINTDPDSLEGNEIGIMSSNFRELCEVVQDAIDSLDPDNSEGQRLDVVCSITGTTREQATFSSFKGPKAPKVNLNAGITLPAGSLASVLGSPQSVFKTLADVTNTGGSPADLSVEMVCTTTGPVVANAGTLTVKVSAVPGWNSITNASDASLGADTEQDAPLRIRRENELQKAGTSTQPAMQARLLAFTDSAGDNPIRDAFIINNTADVAANGLPPKSFEAVIWDGPGHDAQDADIASVIYGSMPLGIGPVGTTSVLITDSRGNPIAIPFTRVTVRTISIRVTYNYNAKTYAGDTAVKTALADSLNDKTTGQKTAQNVAWSVYAAKFMAQSGIREITLFELMINGGGWVSFTDIAIGLREIAQTDTTDIALIGTAT